MSLPNPSPALDKVVHTWVQKFYPVLGLGSGERLLGVSRLQFCTGEICLRISVLEVNFIENGVPSKESRTFFGKIKSSLHKNLCKLRSFMVMYAHSHETESCCKLSSYLEKRLGTQAETATEQKK